jgi:hypothetical protein
MTKKLITSTIVEEEDRSEFMVKHFPGHFMTVENAVYTTLDKICKDYRGGYWQFVELSNGGGYMMLDADRPDGMKVACDNHYSGYMTPDAASIVACLYAINSAVWLYPDNLGLTDHYHWLRDFAVEHAEMEKILGAID